jgi:hypothetical protein
VPTHCDALGSFPPRSLAPLFAAPFAALRHAGVVACLAPACAARWPAGPLIDHDRG